MCIAKVTGVNGTTINAKPVTNRVVDGKSVEFPEFIEVPAVNIQGGGSSLSMPISSGDYALLIFSEVSFDKWWHGHDFKDPHESAKFDYSDAVAIVGVNPGGMAIPNVATFIKDVLFTDSIEVVKNIKYGTIETDGNHGVSGSFTSNDGKTITVTNGIITGII